MKILFFGDSIIEGSYGVSFIEMLKKLLLTQSIEIISKGQMGDTSYDLIQRLDRDVFDLKPQYVFIHVGINDLMTYISREKSERMEKWTHFISPDIFNKNIHQLVWQMQRVNIKVVIILPGGIEGQENKFLNEKFNLYIEQFKKLSKDFGLVYIDFRNSFMKAIAQGEEVSHYAFTLSNIVKDMKKIYRQYPPYKVIKDKNLQYEYYDYLSKLAEERNLSLTFDGAHFTQKGAEIIAKEVVNYIKGDINFFC